MGNCPFERRGDAERDDTQATFYAIQKEAPRFDQRRVSTERSEKIVSRRNYYKWCPLEFTSKWMIYVLSYRFSDPGMIHLLCKNLHDRAWVLLASRKAVKN